MYDRGECNHLRFRLRGNHREIESRGAPPRGGPKTAPLGRGRCLMLVVVCFADDWSGSEGSVVGSVVAHRSLSRILQLIVVEMEEKTVPCRFCALLVEGMSLREGAELSRRLLRGLVGKSSRVRRSSELVQIAGKIPGMATVWVSVPVGASPSVPTSRTLSAVAVLPRSSAVWRCAPFRSTTALAGAWDRWVTPTRGLVSRIAGVRLTV